MINTYQSKAYTNRNSNVLTYLIVLNSKGINAYNHQPYKLTEQQAIPHYTYDNPGDYTVRIGS